jgi:hypothetical protein
MKEFVLSDEDRRQIVNIDAFWNETRKDFCSKCPICQSEFALAIDPKRHGWKCSRCGSHGEVIYENDYPPDEGNDRYRHLDHAEPAEYQRYHRQARVSTAEFLKAIHRHENAKIHFNVDGLTWRKAHAYEHVSCSLAMLNDYQKDIYYIPNAGGRQDKDITDINSFFIDQDAGRDISGKFFSEDIVTINKIIFLSRIYSFPIPPSIIVESRNGYHAYWLAKQGCNIEQFKEVQARLVRYFQSDESVVKPCQVMRLPNFFWYKKSFGCKPFYVRIVSVNQNRYEAKDLLSHLVDISQFHDQHDMNGSKTTDGQSTHNKYSSVDSISRLIVGTYLMSYQPKRKKPNDQPHEQSTHNKYSSKDICYSIIVGTSHDTDGTMDKNGSDSCSASQKTSVHKSNTSSIIVGTFPPANTIIDPVDEIKKKDLAEFLNESGSNRILCPFHNDSTPSASIYQDPSTGYWWLKCHSSRCGFKGTIIDIVMRQQNMSAKEAIHFLMDYYGLSQHQASSPLMCVDYLDDNIRRIENVGTMKETHPHLYRVLSRIKEDLISKLEIAKECMVTNLCFSEGQIVFFCSLREFYRRRKGIAERPKYVDNQNTYVDRYCLLHLMEKLSDDKIPLAMRSRAQEEQRKHNAGYRIQFYSVPNYTPELLKQADEIASVLKKRCLRLKGISRASIEECFGSEVADRVYPLCKGKTNRSGKSDFLSKLEKVLMDEIRQRGYVTFQCLYQKMHEQYDWKHPTEDRVARYLPELLQKHRLREVHSNNELKQRFGLCDPGFPKIIIPATKDSNNGNSDSDL